MVRASGFRTESALSASLGVTPRERSCSFSRFLAEGHQALAQALAASPELRIGDRVDVLPEVLSAGLSIHRGPRYRLRSRIISSEVQERVCMPLVIWPMGISCTGRDGQMFFHMLRDTLPCSFETPF